MINRRKTIYTLIILIIVYFIIYYSLYNLTDFLITDENLNNIKKIFNNKQKTIFVCNHNLKPFDCIFVYIFFKEYMKKKTNIITISFNAYLWYKIYKLFNKLNIKIIQTKLSSKINYMEMNERIKKQNENLLIFIKENQTKTKSIYKCYKDTNADISLLKYELTKSYPPVKITIEDINKEEIKDKNLEDFNKYLLNKLYN